MPESTSQTPWILDKHLATHWHELLDRIGPDAHNVSNVLAQTAETQLTADPAANIEGSLADRTDVSRVLGAYVSQLVRGGAHDTIMSLDHLVTDFEQFVTQPIARAEEQTIALERRFVETFARHAALRLRPKSFSADITWARETLKSLIQKAGELSEEQTALELDIKNLRQVFIDTDGRAFQTLTRAHKLKNKITVIMGYAELLMNERLNEAERREFLRAITATVAPYTKSILQASNNNPIELISIMHPWVTVDAPPTLPAFKDQNDDPKLILEVLEHLVSNARNAGAETVRIQVEHKPTDPVLAIGIEDDGPGISSDLLSVLGKRQIHKIEGGGGTGWEILNKELLPRLNARYRIISPHQIESQTGTLVMLFIPVVAETGDTPGPGRTRGTPTRPRSAISDVTPTELPAVGRPTSWNRGVEPALASGVACFGQTPGILLKFPTLK